MTLIELREYAKEVGVPERVFNQVFAPFIADEGRVLDDMEAALARSECDRMAEFYKALIKILDKNRQERNKKKEGR